MCYAFKLTAMNAPRALLSLRWWVLAWFVLAIGVSVASPLVQPRAMEIVCSGAGMARILLHTDQGQVELGAQGLDCPLCLLAGAAPASDAPLWHAPVTWLRLAVRPVPAPALTSMAVPPPARGPPLSLPLSYF